MLFFLLGSDLPHIAILILLSFYLFLRPLQFCFINGVIDLIFDFVYYFLRV